MRLSSLGKAHFPWNTTQQKNSVKLIGSLEFRSWSCVNKNALLDLLCCCHACTFNECIFKNKKKRKKYIKYIKIKIYYIK